MIILTLTLTLLALSILAWFKLKGKKIIDDLNKPYGKVEVSEVPQPFWFEKTMLEFEDNRARNRMLYPDPTGAASDKRTIPVCKGDKKGK